MSDDRPKRIEFTVSDQLWDRIEAARGHEARASFVKRALVQKLNLELELQAHPPRDVATVLGSPVRKVPSLKDTWGR